MADASVSLFVVPSLLGVKKEEGGFKTIDHYGEGTL